MTIKKANDSDALEISQLLNIAYRGNTGWTTESHLISGDRCTAEDIKNEIEQENTVYLIYGDKKINACISIQTIDHKTLLGSFAVSPDHQNQGLGKCILEQAELFAKEELKAHKLFMDVLCERHELIAFYERRGYHPNGNIKRYPIHKNVGKPINIGQTIMELEKILNDTYHQNTYHNGFINL